MPLLSPRNSRSYLPKSTNAGGDAILAPVRTLLETQRFGCAVVTQDWHRAGHVSFASSHTGRKPLETISLWPRAAGERPATGLTGHLRERGVAQVHICGLARDFCVLWSADDAADAGFETTVIWDLTRPVDPTSDAAVRAALAERRVRITDLAGAAR